MKLTKGGKGLYMHCLPADITGVSCKEGEVSADVFERYRLETYREACHKPFVIAAMILLARFENPGHVLKQLAQRKIPAAREFEERLHSASRLNAVLNRKLVI